MDEVTVFIRGGFRLAKPDWWGNTQKFLNYNPVAVAVVGAMNQWSSITTNAMLTTASLMAPVPKFGLDRMGASGTRSANYVNLASKARTKHILAGDATGGGHAWFGSGKSFMNGVTGKKSMFPASYYGYQLNFSTVQAHASF